MTEIWRPIRGVNDCYYISNLGRVKSGGRWVNHSKKGIRFVREKILKQYAKPNGYMSIGIYLNKNIKTFYVHRLVAINFIDNPLIKGEVNHKDGDKTNNKVCNLEWVTKSENIKHAMETGLLPVGDQKANASLKNDQVVEIKKLLLLNKYTCRQIASKFNVSKDVIHFIKVGKSWRGIS